MDIIQGGWSPLARVGVNGLHRTHPPPHHLLHWCPHTQMTMTIFMMVMMYYGDDEYTSYDGHDE